MVHKNTYLFFLVLGGALLCLYYNMLWHPFINFDDHKFIVKNTWIQELNIAHIKEMFTSQKEGHYQPLSWFFYALEYMLFELNAKGYQVVSIAFHFLNSVLIYRILKQVTFSNFIVYASVFIFAFHPLHVEPIAWKSAQSTLFYMFWGLCSFYCYIFYQKTTNTSRLFLSFLFFLMACLSKSSAIVFWIIFLAYDLFILQRTSLKQLLYSFLQKLPFFAVSIVVGLKAIVSSKEFGSLGSAQNPFTFFDRFFVICRASFFYIEKFFLPYGYSAIHFNPIKINSLLPMYYYIVPIIIVLVFAFFQFFVFRKTEKNLWYFILAFFVISIGMVSQIISIGNTISAERYAYLSSIPLALLTAFTINKITHKVYLKYSLLLFILLGLSLQTYNRIPVWRSNIDLYKDMTIKYPNQYYAWYALGVSYNDQQNFTEARIVLKKAAALKKESSLIQNALGLNYMAFNEYDSAIACFSRSIALDGRFVDAYMNRGVSFAKIEKIEESLKDLSMVIGFNPNHLDAYKNRAMLRYQTKNYTGAISDLELLKNKGYSPANVHFNLFKIYDKQQKQILALEQLSKVVSFLPKNIFYRMERGLYYNQLLNYDNAIKDFLVIVEQEPKNWVALLNLGISYRNLGNKNKAIYYMLKAQKISNNPSIQNEIAQTN